MDQLLVLVDESDQETGYGEKLHVHQNALLHRAFSIFVFDWDKEEMLLQRRASGKYHSGGLWSNACCSHPRKGETMAHALNNRLKAELGLETDVKIQSPPDGGCFELKKWLSESPVDFTAWFRPAFELAYSVLSRQTIPDRR